MSIGWRARIDTPDGDVCGAGLLVTASRVLTCAHVVDGLDQVMVSFPGVVHAAAIPASVRWRGPWKRQGDFGDIALIELDTAPAGIEPCELAGLGALQPHAGRAGYTLRALGFPSVLDGNGDYVTVTSSADRAIGPEWLQTDADQAHLQRLVEGFSGAGLYLAESGQVVGMLTDAIFDEDAGGYVGRMLPLSTIRRYWDEIDDFLPLSWLEPRRCRSELRTAVAGATVTGDLGRLVAMTFQLSGRQDDLETPWEAIRYVAESVMGDNRLRTFLVALAPDLDDRARSRLVIWANRWKPDWGREIELARPPITSIVVMLRTPTKNGKTHVAVTARPLVNGVWAAPEAAVMVPRNQLREKTEALVSAQISKLRPQKLMIEFAVRTDELALPFDEWHFEQPGGSRPLPMRSVPLIVWNVMRLDPSNVTSSFRVQERWESLRIGDGIAVEPVSCELSYDYDEFYRWLDADENVNVLAYASMPRREWLDAALDIGIPVMIWCRRECAGNGDEHNAHKKLLAQLTQALAGTDPDQLPVKVTRLRKEAMSPSVGGEHHHGRHLTLFWDDPARLPDPPLGGGN
jgi:hypothetical protein